MHMQKTLLIAALTAVLAACGGGDDSSASTGATTTGGTTTGTTVGTVAQPVSLGYMNVNYLQDLAATSGNAVYVDKGVGVAGSLQFDAAASSSSSGITVTMTPASDGGIAYGAPFTKGVAVGSHSTDANLPAVAMLCQAISGTGTNGAKSTDVLVNALALPITNATALAGKTFSVYREDCAVTAGSSLTFDSAGNATAVTANGTTNISAANVTAALSATNAPSQSGGAYVALKAYSYVKQDGSTAYAIVEHGGPALTALTRGYVSLWSQQ